MIPYHESLKNIFLNTIAPLKQKEIKKLKGKCPECDATIDVPDDAVDGEILTCDECGSDIEVLKSGEKIQLKKAELKGEDWGE
jgi:alpha-aminoadipate carrier protein LysW